MHFVNYSYHQEDEMKLPEGEYWIYLRKSRADIEAEARGEGETLSKHRKALFKFAKERKLNITRVFQEIVSGESILHRPQMMEMLRLMEESPPKGVLCMDIDRLGRGDKIDQGIIERTFKNTGTLIVTPTEIYDMNDESGEFNVEVRSFLARLELKQTTKRLQGGRLRSVEEGNYLATRPPYGYLIEKNAKGERYLVPHPDQAPIVKMIYEWYTHDDPGKRMGSNKIARELNRLGYKTYSGKPWDASTVLSILKNAVYAGRIQWKKKEQKKSSTPGKKRDTRTRPRHEWIDVPGKHEPLISMETYQKAQEILGRKYHVPYQIENGIANPLAGLIRCDKCNASMVLRPYTHQQPHIICYNRRFCGNKSSRLEYVETKLLESLRDWLKQYKAEWSDNQPETNFSINEVEIKKKALSNLRKELSELEMQKERLHDLLERGIYDEQTYLERSQNLTERIANTLDAINQTETELEKEIKKEQAQKDIIPQVESVLELYDQTDDPSEKNLLLKSILEKATYRKEKYQKNDEFTLMIYPKLPNTDKHLV